MAKRLIPQFADDNFPIYGYDGGNERAKVSVAKSRVTSETDEGSFFRNSIQLNAVVEISKREYDQAAARHRGQQPDYSFLHLIDNKKDVFLVIGDTAMNYIRDFANERKMNKAKYARNYHGVQFIRGLTVIHKGSLPPDLHVLAGHPPLNSEKADAIQAALQGTWKLDFMGEKHTVNVHTVKAVDEIMAAAMNIRLRVDGNANGRAATMNRGTTVGFDLGGGTLDVMKINDKGLPVAGTLDSAEVGIFDAIMEFKAAFDNTPEYSEAIGESTSGIPLEKVYEIFRDPEHKLRGGGLVGGFLDCSDIYRFVMAGELNRLYAITKGLLGNIALAGDQVTVFGGAGDLLFEEIAESIFPTYAENGLLLRGADKGYGILGASMGLVKFGTLLRRLEQKKLQEVS